MKKLILSNTGFPVHVKTLEFLQDNAMNGIKALANLYENYTVLWGIEANANNTQISEGAFVYNGEIIPFKASTAGSTISINEVVEQFNFNTNPSTNTSLELLPAYSSKTAQIGSGGVHTFNFNLLKRLPKTTIFTLNQIEENTSGDKTFNITSQVDINIIKRAFDWEFTFIQDENGLKSIRSNKQQFAFSNQGFMKIDNVRLEYDNSNVYLKMFMSSTVINPKLIVHYL